MTASASHSGSRAENEIGHQMHRFMVDLFPVCRSLTGNGVRATLHAIREHVPIEITEIPTGTQVFDWRVPQEWNIRDAYIADRDGNRLVDFQRNNLHVVGYSTPVDRLMPFSELQGHLFSLPEQPDAIPYVTSYYRENWGFCMAHSERARLREDAEYRVVIDSELTDGHLTYGDLVIKGSTDREVFISTYVCHPSMANNELSGPAVATYIAKWLASQPRRLTYRILFTVETIGSIAYLSRYHEKLKRDTIAGFNLSCVGDDRGYSYVASRYGTTLADRVVGNVLTHRHPDYTKYSFLDRGSDERQYCSPGIDLPLVTLCRSKFATFPEYHTSLDDLDFVTPSGLQGSYDLLKDCIELLERNGKPMTTCLGEPQLGKRGLYPTTSTRSSGASVKPMMNLIAYADGSNDLIDISNLIGVPVWELYPMLDKLVEADLMALA